MLGKIFASIILISVVYIFCVFLAPNLADSMAEKLGISSVNTTIRQLKDGVDSTSDTLLQINNASGAINGVRNFATQANEKINQTTEMINSIRQTGEQKIQQVQQTAESIRKAQEAINEVQNNIANLTSISGSVSGSGTVATGSGQ
ncbi:hypothetical protein GW819_03215 [Candidatus Gracilibacteria bacterium]|nr:hypothetical protein [bacterium]NDK19825.1 hypothetical protein [Candidatus Gracilibacteria bacterium]OIO76161.1 MAG: hypothetical protein AUJ87_03430 [Candidatus Gracilibacteria bacterium CG1_02_38_174]PIQ11734.1 MAG: hypothetical protein COW68_02045 [Candidatus Gracilibacteria bacterium CG18_big_fil_WC_8_21_14_2_50_38_16]PIQ41007.1 MAG: hypothetical protein COW06_04360 [Candidatus Gracilibacteria bacterium CG12_big_fil_rev_8_21_14_0_65_38_15]PIZ01958.1 MAG: hypothetical protein COY60_0088